MNAKYERVYKLAVGNAKRPWGTGWDMLSPAMQQAIVKAAVLDMINAQDEDVSAASLRNLADHGALRAIEDFH
jgi:hypothetical protein